MFRKMTSVLAAAVAIGIACIPAEALARGHGGGGGGGGFHGGGFHAGGFRAGGFAGMSAGMAHPRALGAFPGGGPRIAGLHHVGHLHRRHFRGFGFVGPYGYWDDPYYYGDDDCYQLRHVLTRHGWRWRRVDICG